MGKNARDRRPNLRPVTRIELSEKNIKVRWILIALFLAIGVTAFALGFSELLNVQPGWNEVQADADGPSVAGDFKLMYDFTDSGGSAAAVNKNLIACYSQAAQDAYRIFTADVPEAFRVNEAVTVEPALYVALEQVVNSGSRQIFLAPALEEYNRVFLCETDAEAALYDPQYNADTAAWLKELAVFVRDPEQISLELLGNSQVMLRVGEAYLAFARENEIETFLDFGWLRNAFAADYIAGVLQENGFTSGYLTSYDGFTRNLDSRGEEFSFNLFDRRDSDINLPGRMRYAGPISMVFLRDYPMAQEDRWHYYSYETGQILTAFLDPQDCMSKSSVHNLAVYSETAGCAELALKAGSVFTADSFAVETVQSWQAAGIYAIWPQEQGMGYNDPELKLDALDVAGYDYDFTLVTEK